MYRMNHPEDLEGEEHGEEEFDEYEQDGEFPATYSGDRPPSPRREGRISPRNLKGIRPHLTNSSLSGKDAVGLLGMSIARASQRSKNKQDGVHPRDAWKQFLNSNPEVLKQNPSLISVENATDIQRLEMGQSGHNQMGKSAPSNIKQGDKLDGKLNTARDAPLKDSDLVKSKVTTSAEVTKKFVPFFANMVENRIRHRLKEWHFKQVKDQFSLLPKKMKYLEKIEKLIQKSVKQSFFSHMEDLMEQDSLMSEKLREFYRLNLKRIFFNTLRSFGSFQRAWVAQVRESILKCIVFETIKRNHVEEKVARKVEAYHVSRLLRAWHRVAEVEGLEAQKVIEEFQGHRHSRTAYKVIKEMRANALAGKQERRRDLDSILQYQRLRIYKIIYLIGSHKLDKYRILEFWRTQATKRKKPVDFARYQGLNSIPMRITQKKIVELLDDGLSKFLKSKPISTTFRLLHPSMKTT